MAAKEKATSLPPPKVEVKEELGDPKSWVNDSVDAYREKEAKVNAAFATLVEALDGIIGDREPTADEEQGAQLLESARSWYIR